MSLQIMIPWMLGALATSIAAMVSGAWSGLPPLVTAGALLFALAMVASCWHINRPYINAAPAELEPDALALSSRRNARLIAYVYVWGGLAMFALYKGTSLRWQHGVQYAIGMTVIGLIVISWVHYSWRQGSWLVSPSGLKLARNFTILHALSALGGLAFLIGSGKLLSEKGDWAANRVFLAGGLAVIGISIIAARTYFHLDRPKPPTVLASNKAAGATDPS